MLYVTILGVVWLQLNFMVMEIIRKKFKSKKTVIAWIFISLIPGLPIITKFIMTIRSIIVYHKTGVCCE